MPGRKLVDLERKLLEKEKQEFFNRRFTLEDVQKFRQENKIFQELDEFKGQILAQYEIFAIWTEYLLSKKFDSENDFEKRYNSFSKQVRESVDSMVNFNNQYGDLATFYASGFAKVQDKKRLSQLSNDLFKDSLDENSLILHFGSGKLFSDIDLCSISNKIEPSYCEWFDLRAYK